MKSIVLTAVLAVLTGVAAAGDDGDCPTITSTAVCSTCIRPLCVRLSTVTPGCGCPAAVPTVKTSVGCDKDCPGGCAGTQYITATANCDPEPTDECD